MPFTPFHFGPGALIKALGGRHCSFLVFAGAQVLMDLEVGIRMVALAMGDLGAGPPDIGVAATGAPGAFHDPILLHGWSHTIGGALTIGAVAALIGKPIANAVLCIGDAAHQPITWTAAIVGAFTGTFTHILLDAVMHADMLPWRPIAGGNGLLDVISLTNLHLFCLICGVVGGLAMLIRKR